MGDLGDPVSVSKSAEEQAEEALEKKRHQQTRREKDRIIKSLMSRIEELEFRNEWIAMLEGAPPSKPAKVRKHKTQRGKTAATFCALASDWHVEERVRPDLVGGKNDYRPEISAERAEAYTRNVVKILGLNRRAWDIREMVQWLGGDFITGHLHLEAVQENYLAPGEAGLLAFDYLRRHLDALLQTDLERIIVVCNYGNHGRLPDKPQPSMGFSNLEWMLYRILERWYDPEDRLVFQIADGYETLTDLYGYTVRWHHGDEVKYRGGLGGITVPFYGRTGRQAQGGDLADLDVIGHHHSLQHPRKLIINGSLIGYNPYAASKGFPFERPVQGSFCVDEDHRTNFWPIETS